MINLITIMTGGTKGNENGGCSLISFLYILKDRAKFNKVFIDKNGNIEWDIDENIDSSIHWNNRIDLCVDSVYLESKPLNQLK